MKIFYITISLLLIGLLIYVLWPRNELKDIDVTQLTGLQTKLKEAEKKRAEIILKARQDSIKQDSATKVKDVEIARLKQAVRKYRTPHVDTVLIQDPEVGRYAATLDSIVVAQDSQIAELKEQKVEQWNNFNKLIMASDSTFKVNQELNNYLLETEKKRTKQSKNKRFGIGPHVGYDVTNRVTFGVSVNFDLVRF